MSAQVQLRRKTHPRTRRELWKRDHAVLPLDLRDPDIFRAKKLARAAL